MGSGAPDDVGNPTLMSVSGLRPKCQTPGTGQPGGMENDHPAPILARRCHRSRTHRRSRWRAGDSVGLLQSSGQLRHQPLSDEVDRALVVPGAVDVAPKPAVERSIVQRGHAAALVAGHFGKEGHVVHAAEDTAIGGLGNDQLLAPHVTERFRRKLSSLQLPLDEHRDELSGRSELADSNIWFEDAEQRRGISKEKTLAAIEDEQVGVPVVVSGFARRHLRGSEDVEELLGAAKDHRANSMRVAVTETTSWLRTASP